MYSYWSRELGMLSRKSKSALSSLLIKKIWYEHDIVFYIETIGGNPDPSLERKKKKPLKHRYLGTVVTHFKLTRIPETKNI